MKTLDRKRDFGTITGDTRGRMYEQDHCYFKADGSLWVDPVAAPKPEPKAVKAQAANKAQAEAAAVTDQLSQQLKG